MSKPTLPSIINRAVTLRAAGHTLSSITAQTGLSASSLYRYFKRLDIERGSVTSESVAKARKNLLNDTTFIDQLKQKIAISIADDLAISRQIREALAMSLEEIIGDSTMAPALKSRSLAALSTSLKLTPDVQRKALNIDNKDPFNTLEELPILTIVKMTDAEIQAAQDRFKDKAEHECELEEE
jgi:AcrR family transcriptional regulator